ncbi:DUF2795 domain-containing protein [Streptomyces sp. AV19]|uniref:DUF2795 domain-containing protein n=1 Tax=Streptomyces sp. AV19 TaxID=2793068 RepID=UPI0018FE5358|nr:DUF2795 domain-containing protein [Streptomyces sp. AV19]MBH1937776.1 DUF2795 domain-containing protein [Streptomyces sp. AV19]MDG4533664.1 DUF2795 domain-containing protein [Streptomyces sp. AV19]
MSLTFPAVKGEILDMAASMDLDEEVLDKLQRIPDLEYFEDSDVTTEMQKMGYEA